jgi:hypothetical protein
MSNAGASFEAEMSALFLHLETQLMDPEFRKDSAKVSEQLADDFREFGSSGRHWTRQEILDLLATEPTYSAPEIEDFRIQKIASDVVLVTYRARRVDTATLRSSIWIYRDEKWQILFHQGTKIP